MNRFLQKGKNYTPLGHDSITSTPNIAITSKNSAQKELFKGLYLSVIALLIKVVLDVFFVLLILAISTLTLSGSRGLSGLGIAVVLGWIARYGPLCFSVVALWFITIKFHVKNGFLIAFFTVINFLPFTFLFGPISAERNMAWNGIFFAFFLLFYLLFSIRRVSIYIILILATIISVVNIGWIPRLIVKSITQDSQARSDECFSEIDLQLYAPKKQTGKYLVEKYLGQDFCYISKDKQPIFATSTLNYGMKLYQFEAPTNYGTDEFCGKETPSGKSSYSPDQHCEKVGKTSSGGDVYMRNLNPINAKIFPETVFTRIDNTVIALHLLPATFKVEDAIEFFNSLEPVTLGDLKLLDDEKKNEFEKIENSKFQYVTFDLYAPSYLPEKISKNGFEVKNTFNASNPDVFLKLKHEDIEDNSTFKINEFRSAKQFNPEENITYGEKHCGADSAENEDRFDPSESCEYLATTPSGIKVYGNYFNIFFTIGSTKIVIGRNGKALNGTEEVLKIVESMQKRSIAQIEQEYKVGVNDPNQVIKEWYFGK